MNPYAYMGASWANQASRSRQQSQNQARMWGQYAPQRNQQVMGRNRLVHDQGLAADARRGQFFRFGVNALTGLMR